MNYNRKKSPVKKELGGGILLMLFLICFSGRVFSQDKYTVTGKVTDENSEALPGVGIHIQGTEKGTVTNAAGKFHLRASDTSTLIFTYIGYGKRRIRVDGRKNIRVRLRPSVSSLNELVVLGYGTVKKRDLTGAVSQIKLDNPEEKRIISIPEALEGKIAGVRILNNTGEPGSGMTFLVRGATSVTGSNRPLIVIDGQPMEPGFDKASAGQELNPLSASTPFDPLATLNVDDIASVEVLKDATATAIYGSRGANGVVLITTKSGESGKNTIRYSVRTDFSSLPRQMKMLGARDYMDFINEAWANDGKDYKYDSVAMDTLISQYNDFQDLIYRNAFSQNHELSVSGGNKKNTTYFISGNYADQKSIILNSGLQRGGLRFNFSTRPLPKLKIGLRSYLSFTKRDYAKQSNSGSNLSASAVTGALAYNPLRSPYSVVEGAEELDEDFTNSPLLLVTRTKDKTHIRNGFVNFTADYAVLKNLSYQFRGAVHDFYTLREVYWPHGTFLGNTYNGRAVRADNANTSYLMDNIFTYHNVVNKKHTINVMGGFSYQSWLHKGSSVSASDFPDDALLYNNFASANVPGITRTINRQKSLESVIGRVKYAYKHKYLLTLTGRWDGDTRLAEGHKWNFFPSVGGAWNLSDEKFFRKNIKFISNFKLRGSYGIAGNANIPIGGTQASYSIRYGSLGSGLMTGYIPDKFATNLTWENTAQLDLGTDLSLLNNRIAFTFDYYRKKTTGLLISLSLPMSSTYLSTFTNTGEVQNNGFDVEGHFSILTGKLKWNLDANFSHYHNEIIDLGSSDIIYGHVFLPNGQLSLDQAITVAKEGAPLSSFWGYKTAGVYQNQGQIDKDPYIKNDPDKNNISPGDVRWVDVNGDGQINSDDKTIIGNPNPDFTVGLSSAFSYKKLDFSFSILGSYGNDIANLTQWIVGTLDATGNYNITQDAWNHRWHGEGTGNKYPQAGMDPLRLHQRFPDWMVEDGSFVRLQSVSVGYHFNLSKGKDFPAFKVFVSATNLLTVTGYSGYDPDINAFAQYPITEGVDLGTLPQPRTFSAGITCTL